ncbi:MAG: YdeI/OmpD-associated family protein [Asticcacaulis sp.]|uniref:YdeI/OmpD-associated family protein n=1 Tax=Asticcacaulis sp. TaxID=1872648 RepID=UPI0039E571FC
MSTLTRDIHPIPNDVRQLLHDRGLWEAYQARPPYQQNDYIGWIEQAKREETRQNRIDQMLDELKAGGLYMKMRWNG